MPSSRRPQPALRRIALAAAERQCGGDQGAAAGRALELEPPAERRHPVVDTDKPVTSGIRTSHTVVADLDA